MPRSTVGFILLMSCVACAALPRPVSADDKDSAQVPSNPATAHELPQIMVIANSPLSGLGLQLNVSRRYGELGFDPRIGHLHGHAAVRLQSGFRAQYVGRRPGRTDKERT
jgi:hypothetical protein